MKDNYLVSLGACEEVTGSMHLLVIDVGKGKQVKILLDAGSFQGPNDIAKNNYISKSINVADIDCVMLTHGHLDHIGRLPLLTQRGFKGEIFCTPRTRDIGLVVLEDSLKIQDEDEERGIPRQWGEEDLEKVKELLRGSTSGDMEKEYPEWAWKDDKGNIRIKARFIPSEHILGSASILFEEPIRLLYTGDLGGGKSGMHNVPKVSDDVRKEGVDYLIIESTYGDRKDIGDGKDSSPLEQLKQVVEDIRVSKGKLLIASMAIDRTEEILMMLKKLDVKEKVYLDSPMGAGLLRIYVHNRYLLSRVMEEYGFKWAGEESNKEEEVEEKQIEDARKIFRPENLEVVRSRRRSKEVADSNEEGIIIIASSGMLEGGRILEHLAGVLEKEKNILLFTGYQAEGTLGRLILDGAKEIVIKTKKKAPHLERNLMFDSDFVDTIGFGGSIRGEKEKKKEREIEKEKEEEIAGEIKSKITVRADIRKIEGLSAHADQGVLLDYIDGFEVLPSKIFIVHGEIGAACELEKEIKKKFRVKTVVNKFDIEYQLSETNVVEKKVYKDVANIEFLAEREILKFTNLAGSRVAPFGGWIKDEGERYRLISQEDVQDMMLKAIPFSGVGAGSINNKGFEDLELSDDKKLAIESINGEPPTGDELKAELISAYKEGHISKGLIKQLLVGVERGVGEYMKIVEKRIKGKNIILDDFEMRERGRMITKEEREKLLEVYGKLLKRSIKMDTKILLITLDKVNQELVDM